MKAFLDFIPLLAFFVFAMKQNVLVGTAALLITTLVVAVIHLVLQKGKLNKQQLVTLILTVLFCGLTLLLNDVLFVKVKSSVINIVFALALLVSIAMGKPLLKLAMKHIFELTQSGWNKLTVAWALYFILMAGLHTYFAFYTSNETWLKFKLFGWIPFMLLFMVAQFVVLRNSLNPELKSPEANSPELKKSNPHDTDNLK